MKKSLLILGTMFGFISSIFAQSHTHNGARCTYDHVVHQRDALYPGYKAAVDATFDEAKRLAAQNRHLRNTYTIPVIVHVVYKEDVEQISECKVFEQIDILNEDYQRLNPDTSTLRAEFDTIVGNPDINFRLDSIIYKSSDELFYSGGIFPDPTYTDRVKHDSTGGSDAVDPTTHLNIWICSMGSSGVLGYAYPPDGLSNWPAGSSAATLGDEGVVLDYRIVGREGAYDAQGTVLTTQGRAGTHEVGHYLGLRHIWGDGISAIFGIPDCTADDGVEDTPNAGMGSNFACDYTQNTCDDGANDLPDMIENFMDYSDEACQNSFSQGQIDIMRGILGPGGAREDLPSSGTAVFDNDYAPFANESFLNTAAGCALVTNGTTVGASPSMSACSGTEVANDVWYYFTASSNAVDVEISNVVAMSGNNTDMVFEVFENTCDDMLSLGCETSGTGTISGLTTGSDYLIRVYSADSASTQTFDLCLTAATASSVQNLVRPADVEVAPNPTTGQITISLPTTGAYEGVLSIQNVLGQRVANSMNIDNATGTVFVDLSKQAAGIYLVELIVGNQRITKKVVLEK